MTDKKIPPIWADFLKNAADKDAMKPFIAAASVFSKEAGVVSGIADARALLDVYGSALSDPDEGLTSSAGSKSKYYSSESYRAKEAELHLARALTLAAATVLCLGAHSELNFPRRMRDGRNFILDAIARADDTRHQYIRGKLSSEFIEDFENLLHAVSFHRDWNGEPHHVYSAQIAKFAREWNMKLHHDFMTYLVRTIGVQHVEESMGQLVHALRMVGFIHQSREGNATKAVAMRQGTFDASIGIKVVEHLVGGEARRRRELQEAQERAIAEQIREVEELARQQVELEMNPMLNSW